MDTIGQWVHSFEMSYFSPNMKSYFQENQVFAVFFWTGNDRFWLAVSSSRLMFGQLVFCFTKCSLENVLFGTTRLKNTYWMKTQLLKLVKLNSLLDLLYQMRQRWVIPAVWSILLHMLLLYIYTISYHI